MFGGSASFPGGFDCYPEWCLGGRGEATGGGTRVAEAAEFGKELGLLADTCSDPDVEVLLRFLTFAPSEDVEQFRRMRPPQCRSLCLEG